MHFICLLEPKKKVALKVLEPERLCCSFTVSIGGVSRTAGHDI